MIKRMVDIIKYDNQYAYQLLRRVTLNKHAVVMLDGCSVYLEAKDKNDYLLIAKKAKRSRGTEEKVQFCAGSLILRQIMTGITKIDNAIVGNEIFIQASFEDLMNVYHLIVTLLVEGSLNTRLRNLWQEFDENWENNNLPLGIKPLEQQSPKYDFLISKIPEGVLLIKP